MHTDEFRPHDVVWTHEKSSRFWEFKSSQIAAQSMYFSNMVGSSLLRLVRSHGVDLKGRILDFGAGPGFLLRSMIRQGIACEGLDFSPTTVQQVRRALAEEPLFRGMRLAEDVPTAYPDGSFDVVFLIETIEHLVDEDLADTLDEIQRILRVGGTVVVSTPNEEDLGLSATICPDCGCTFHTMQHVRSWSAASLTARMCRHGFEPAVCRSVHLHDTWYGSRLRYLKSRLLGRKMPHLFYIGTKGGGTAAHDVEVT